MLQLLKHVTIAAGGVLPRIHPELLVRKKGGKVLNVVTAPKIKKAASVAAAKAADLLKPSTTTTADKGKKKTGKKLKVATVSVRNAEMGSVCYLKLHSKTLNFSFTHLTLNCLCLAS